MKPGRPPLGQREDDVDAIGGRNNIGLVDIHGNDRLGV